MTERLSLYREIYINGNENDINGNLLSIFNYPILLALLLENLYSDPTVKFLIITITINL